MGSCPLLSLLFLSIPACLVYPRPGCSFLALRRLPLSSSPDWKQHLPRDNFSRELCVPLYFLSLDINSGEETLDHLTISTHPLGISSVRPHCVRIKRRNKGLDELNKCVGEHGQLCAGAAVGITSVKPMGLGDPVPENGRGKPGHGSAGRCRTVAKLSKARENKR